MPLPVFFSALTSSRTGRRYRAVSELYAALLMISVTLAFGGAVTGLAVAQFSQSATSASGASAFAANSASRQLSFINALTSQPSGCATYRGTAEGGSLGLVFYNYGSVSVSPASLAINGSLYTGPFGTLSPGTMTVLTVALVPHGSCAHQSGQSIMMLDSSGDEFQFES